MTVVEPPQSAAANEGRAGRVARPKSGGPVGFAEVHLTRETR